ncbi:hypothetical protein [Candidatus Roseilinea sp. NK_OTU-006]|jgi:hypothetical protein|uniref:hypothetical protein n=1 Tax=Candidatus Roseilinea sp. NK_OTU-006 TaxID=2704250 RepID=UPI00145C9A26|nr:hypothetical protein [Candidatus Roseilinea sp. NK_OTU-006]
MSELNRRDFLKIGIGSLAGLAAGQFLPMTDQASQGIVRASPGTTEVVSATFILDQRTISQVNIQTNQVLHYALWGIPGEYEALLPKLVSPLSVSLSELEEWAMTRCNEVCGIPENLASPSPNWDVFESAMNVPIVGLPNMSDLIGKTITTIVDGASLDLSLEFLYDSRLEQAHKIYLPLVQLHAFQHEATIATIEPPRVETGAHLITVAPPPSVTMFGWKLQFRGPETHPLGSCVSQNVNHFHVEVFRQNPSGRWDYVLNVHLGAYRSSGRRCFVLYNNTRPYVCWKVCSPTRNQLKEMFVWILIAAAAIAGVVLAAWIISAIASAAATVAWPVLLLL